MSYVTKEQAMLADIVIRLNNLEKKIGKHIHITTRGLESTRLRQEKLESLLDRIDRFMNGSEMTMSELLDRTEHMPRKSLEDSKQIDNQADEAMKQYHMNIKKMDESKESLEITTQEAKENPTLEEFAATTTTTKPDLGKKFWPEDYEHKQQESSLPPTQQQQQRLVIPREAYQRVKIYRSNLESYADFNHIGFKPAPPYDYDNALEWKLTIRLNELRAVHKRPVRKHDKRPRFRKFEVFMNVNEVNAVREITKEILDDKNMDEIGLYLKMRSAGYIKKEDREAGNEVYINRTIRFKRKDLKLFKNKIWNVISQSKSINILQGGVKVVVK